MKMERQSLLELKDCTDGESTNEPSYSQRKHRPTCIERALYVIVIGSIVLAFTIAALFGYIYQANKVSWRSLVLLPNSATFTSKNFSTEFTPPNLCLTPGCIKAAAEILSNIDESVEPCADFYQFACGGWINRHPIPENRGMVSFFGISQDELNLQMKELLEKKLDGSEPYFIPMLKNMYESCMDLKSIEEANSEPLSTVLKALGGWPVVERNNWNESAFDWIETLKSLRSFGYSHRMLLDLSVEVDNKNITTHRISLGQAELGVPDRTYLVHGLNDSSALAYFNLMIKAAKKLGADETTAERELLKSFHFEASLANFSLPREAFRNSSKIYNKYTVRKLQQLVPQSIEEANSEPLSTVLKALGGWPVVERNNWNESAFDWIETLKSLRSFGYSHRMLLDLSVEVDNKNITTHRISLGQAELGVPDRTYLVHGLNDSSALAYFNLMIKAAKKLGADETTAERELLKSFHFEASLANFSLPREAFRNSSKIYNKYTVRKLQQLVPQVPWLKYFNSLLDEEIHEDEPLIVSDVHFIIMFGELISTTEKRVISNYVLWRVVFQSLSYLSAEWRNLLHEYSTAITGRHQQNPRWEECLFSLTGDLNTALSSYYVRNYFDEENKEAGMKLYRYIHKEFLENLEKIDWMEKETKKEAKAKVEAIEAYSGYPDELLNDTLIQEIYTNLNITKDSFFHNTLRLKKWASDSEYALLRKPYLKRQWMQHSNAVLVNSFYRGVENSIEFLAGILRKGFFDKNRPHFMNFGAIGFVLAHELTHSLDDVGRQFDKDGNNVNWWDKTTEEKFWKKAQCIIDEFNSFTAKNGMKLNGVNTQGENIADNGGFKIAYKAYQSWIRDNGPDLKLPGLKYTPSQLFWISTCNIWCGKFRPEALKLRILTGTHTPNNFRIIGGFSNLAEFSQEFNCSSDTQMNHNNKCTIW